MEYNQKTQLNVDEIYHVKALQDTGLHQVLHHSNKFRLKVVGEYDNYYTVTVLCDKDFMREINTTLSKNNLHCGKVKIID